MGNIYHDIEIKATQEAIYEAITSPSGLNAWWTLKSAGEPSIGNEYNFFFSEDYNWFAVVQNISANESIIYRMTQATDDWIGTILSFEIISQSESLSLLRFEHRGWKEITEHYRRTSYCWALYLSCLKEYLEKGIIKSYELRGII